MKHILESADIFELYAQIDACYFLLDQNFKQLSQPRSSIEAMVDNVTGYGKDKHDKMVLESIELINQVIECKKKINAPYAGDEKFLHSLLKIQQNGSK